jgi:CheY-like chemotaxis protein
LEAFERQHPDIILLDIRMPIMNGLEACQLLKSNAETQLIPILCLSALSMPHEIEEGLSAGANAYIQTS